MANWQPTPAGPRNLRELFHWVFEQFKRVGTGLGDEGGTLPPEDAPEAAAHTHWIDNLANTDVSGDVTVFAARTNGDSLVFDGTTGYWVADRRTKVFFQPTEPALSNPGDIWFAEGYE